MEYLKSFNEIYEKLNNSIELFEGRMGRNIKPYESLIIKSVIKYMKSKLSNLKL